LVVACQKEDLSKVEDNTTSLVNSQVTMRVNANDKLDIHTQIVLGKRLKNPYSVKNMQIAFDYYNSVVKNSKFINKVVETTSYYIKITPKSIEDLKILDDLDKESNDFTPVLQDYPMDYEILVEGDYYVSPKDDKDLFYPTYTVIPVGYKLPSGISYKILEELYQPTDDEYDVETVSLFFADWKDDLAADDIFLKLETLPEYLNNALISSSRRKKFTPNGYVKVQNTDSNQYDPLLQAEISYGRMVWWHYTYTDNNGHFSGSHNYRGEVRIRAKWRGYTATIRKSWNEILGIQVSDHLMTLNRNNNGATKLIPYSWSEGEGHLWYKGTVHNGLRKYIDYSNINGISHTISYANVWVSAKGTNTGSTPMLYKYDNLSSMATIAGIGQSSIWNVISVNTTDNLISLLPPHLRPDQTYKGLRNGASNGNTATIHQLVFHESGHYSHASKAGAWFWANVFSSELSNSIEPGSTAQDPYKDGSLPSYQAADRIALAEGWGNLCEFKISQFYYAKAISGNYQSVGFVFTNDIPSFIEGFNVCDRPLSSNHRTSDISWFYHGIMWDLLDDSIDGDNSVRRDGSALGGGLFVNKIIDKANINTSVNNNQYYLAPVFNHLNSNVNNSTDLYNSLINNGYNGTSQHKPIYELFRSYGYL